MTQDSTSETDLWARLSPPWNAKDFLHIDIESHPAAWPLDIPAQISTACNMSDVIDFDECYTSNLLDLKRILWIVDEKVIDTIWALKSTTAFHWTTFQKFLSMIFFNLAVSSKSMYPNGNSTSRRSIIPFQPIDSFHYFHHLKPNPMHSNQWYFDHVLLNCWSIVIEFLFWLHCDDGIIIFEMIFQRISNVKLKESPPLSQCFLSYNGHNRLPNGLQI